MAVPLSGDDDDDDDDLVEDDMFHNNDAIKTVAFLADIFALVLIAILHAHHVEKFVTEFLRDKIAFPVLKKKQQLAT